MHLTISARFCSLKPVSVSAAQAWAQSLIASMAAASTLASTTWQQRLGAIFGAERPTSH
jgi:hypothetical protein